MATGELVELEALRRMTAAEKLAVMDALWRQAWTLRAAGVRREHPEWTEKQVTDRVREIFHGAAS